MTHDASPIQRHNTHAVDIDGVLIGGNNPVVVQSMTNTDTADAVRTAAQVVDLAKAGSELVRITVNNEESAAAVAEIRERMAKMDCYVPLVGDFHFNGHKLLQKHPECAEALAKYRINPGNVGRGKNRDSQFAQMIEFACRYNKPVRIGVNWGSLDQELLAAMLDKNAALSTPKELDEVTQAALIESALSSGKRAEELGLGADKIVISCKLSHVQELIQVYRKLATQSNYALHLGLTEAGMGIKGTVASTAALAVLLQEGIGDTIRVSLTPEPGGDRSTEVLVAQEILQSMGLRAFAPTVVSCPGCGRTSSDFFQHLSEQVQNHLRTKMPEWRRQYAGVESMTVAVMGCVVNGPGESKQADIGISLPGNGEKPVAPVYIDGQKDVTLKGQNIATEFTEIIERYVSQRYQPKTS